MLLHCGVAKIPCMLTLTKKPKMYIFAEGLPDVSLLSHKADVVILQGCRNSVHAHFDQKEKAVSLLKD